MSQAKQIVFGITIGAAIVFGGMAVNAIAADDAPAATTDDTQAEGKDQSAKMGKDAGTYTDPDHGKTPENDTDKIDQPERRNTPSEAVPHK